MSDTLDTQESKSKPSRTEIKNYCKDHLIQNGYAEELSKFDNKLLRDACIWLDGYIYCHRLELAVIPCPSKEIFLDRVAHYVVSRVE